MISDINLVTPPGSSHQRWIIFWGWANFLVIGFILGAVFGGVGGATFRKGFRPKRLCGKRLE